MHICALREDRVGQDKDEHRGGCKVGHNAASEDSPVSAPEKDNSLGVWTNKRPISRVFTACTNE